MPMGPYKDFSACVSAQGRKGRSKASASRICGAIKAGVEGTKKLAKADMNLEFSKYLPISKVNDEERMVYGYASTPDLDSQGEVVELEAIKNALPNYMKFPTIREMHTTNAVGRTKSAVIDDKGLFIGAKIVDDNAWKKVKEGVFNGFSIGGRAVQMIENVIKELRLTEISLVDVPANKSAVITLFKADISKAEVDEVYSKYHLLVNMSASELKNWSETECSKKASLNRSPINRNINLLSKNKADWTASDVRSANRTISFISRMRGAEQGSPVSEGCPSKRDISLKNWGYNPGKKSKVEKAEGVKTGDMVSWNSSGGRATGKVIRVVRNGKVSIPDSTFSISGTEENPGLIIRLYRDGKPTDRIVGHKMSSVKRTTMKSEPTEIIKFAFNWEEVSQLEEIKKQENQEIVNEVAEQVEQVVNEQVVEEQSLSSEELAEVEAVLDEITDAQVEEAIVEATEEVIVETKETEVKEAQDELTDTSKIDETLGKIEKMEKAYEKQVEKFDSIEKMDKAISKLTSIVEKLSERLEKVESTPAESKTKASFLVEKTLGGVQIEKQESVELVKAKQEFADLMRIRETNPERYALEKLSDRAFELKDRIARLSN